jgi:hypothetical protein
VGRHTGRRFTFLRVVHANEDGSNPHLHILVHLLTAKQRHELQAALNKLYGYTAAGGLVVQISSASVASRKLQNRHSALRQRVQFSGSTAL